MNSPCWLTCYNKLHAIPITFCTNSVINQQCCQRLLDSRTIGTTTVKDCVFARSRKFNFGGKSRKKLSRPSSISMFSSSALSSLSLFCFQDSCLYSQLLIVITYLRSLNTLIEIANYLKFLSLSTMYNEMMNK